MTPPPPAAPVPATPSRDDPETIPCPVCQRHFAAVGRQAYCSTACRKTAFRRRHQDPPAAIVIRAARPRHEYTIYECPQLRAAPARPGSAATTAAIFGRRIGNRGPCPHARNSSRSATYSNRNLDNLSASDVFIASRMLIMRNADSTTWERSRTACIERPV